MAWARPPGRDGAERSPGPAPRCAAGCRHRAEPRVPRRLQIGGPARRRGRAALAARCPGCRRGGLLRRLHARARTAAARVPPPTCAKPAPRAAASDRSAPGRARARTRMRGRRHGLALRRLIPIRYDPSPTAVKYPAAGSSRQGPLLSLLTGSGYTVCWLGRRDCMLRHGRLGISCHGRLTRRD
jgi:hypothetical protein